MERERLRDQQRNLKSSSSSEFLELGSELLKRTEEEAFFIHQDMSTQKDRLYTFLLMDPLRRTRAMSSSVVEHQEKITNQRFLTFLTTDR